MPHVSNKGGFRTRKHNVNTPKKYGTRNHYVFREVDAVYRSDGRFDPKVYYKNNGIDKIEGEIKSMLEDLVHWAHINYRDLPVAIKEKFDRLVFFTGIFKDTADYIKLYSWCQNYFSHVVNITPGSIGAYIKGCSVPTSFSSTAPSCSVACAGSMPKPKNFSYCDNSVILGMFDGNDYNFYILQKSSVAEDHSKAYLFINSTDEKAYPGFTDVEKSKLLKEGLQEVKLIGYHPDGRTYAELTTDTVPISQLKPRHIEIKRPQEEYAEYSAPSPYPKKSSGSNAIGIVLAIIFIFVIVIILWCLFSYNSK